MIRSLALTSFLCGALGSVACASSSESSHHVAEAPAASVSSNGSSGARLLVWITVDQMRGDYLKRYEKHWSEAGFRLLLTRGRHYENAHYAHAITETAPGHATLLSGVSPRVHGIIGNEWLLQDGTVVASVTDEYAELVGPGRGMGPQLAEDGRSPHRLLAPTLGDALIEQTGGRSLVVSVSVKDRGAILPGGKLGQAYWLGGRGFVTSKYYKRGVPPWLEEHHTAHPLSAYLSEGWPLARPEGEYENEPTLSSRAPEEWGKSFPHELAKGAKESSALATSPFGDAAVLDLALSAVDGESLGEDESVDLLAISLSSTDKIGHQYGPESRELEDQLIRLDGQLERFFAELSQRRDPKEWVVVLSADHGGCESAEYLKTMGREGRRLTEAELEEAARTALKREYGHEKFFLGVASPYVYLRADVIEKKGQQLANVRRVVADALQKLPGVFVAHARGEELPAGELGARLVEAIYEERSGDIYIVPKRETHFLQTETLAATHGSPWDYDTHVPILLWGPGVEPGKEARPVDVRSIVPTVAELIGVQPPALARARKLPFSEQSD